MAHALLHWQKEPGARLAGARDLDRAKVQAPCIVRTSDGRYRLFYTAVGPGKPFADCQGYILSATSDDGLAFTPEPGIRLASDPNDPPMSLRVLAPSVAALSDGPWRMYFEARGPATMPTTIRSARSSNLIDWTLEPGTRLATSGGVGAPRFRWLGDGTGELLALDSRYTGGGPGRSARTAMAVIRATTTDGLHFAIGSTDLLRDRQGPLDSAGITAAEFIDTTPPLLLFSAWQDRPAGEPAPLHPSTDADAVARGSSADFATASIAADMSGYRSRIMAAELTTSGWQRRGVVIEGDGYGGADIDAVHAEDMSLIALGDGRWRMYYAACDARGVWRIASAVTA
jgi:hypothetical protein